MESDYQDDGKYWTKQRNEVVVNHVQSMVNHQPNRPASLSKGAEYEPHQTTDELATGCEVVRDDYLTLSPKTCYCDR